MKQSIFDQAIAVALSSNAPKKMGAILLDKRNRIVSSGTNSYEITHTKQFYAAVMAANEYNEPSLMKKQYLHCELNCIIRAQRPGHKLIVCRVGGHGGMQLRTAKPCRICYLYLMTNCPTIKEIYWSTNEQEFVSMKIR
jgi:deoxycytidylate deaminase